MPRLSVLFAAFLAASIASAQGGPFVCQTSAGTPALIRAEGIAERVSDVVLTCTGGVAGVSGSANITVSMDSASLDPSSPFGYLLSTLGNDNFTSRIVAPASNGSEALLVIDELSSPPSVGTNVIQGVQPYTNSNQITGSRR